MTYEIHQRDAELRGERRGEARGFARGRDEGRAEGLAEGKILGAIDTYRSLSLPESQIQSTLIQRFNLTPAEATNYLSTPFHPLPPGRGFFPPPSPPHLLPPN